MSRASLPDPDATGAAIVLVRHGETGDSVPPYRFQGRTDTPLNDAGRAQARALAAAAGGLGLRALWSSDLARARETAEIVAARLGLGVRIDRRLSESDRGSWEGRLVEEVAAAEPEAYAAWRGTDPAFRFPGGESLVEHRDRARAAIAEILGGPLPALAVCHGGTIRCLVAGDLSELGVLAVPHCAAFALGRDGLPIPTAAGAAGG